LLKGVVVNAEAEEMEEEAVDSSVGVVGKNKYEEPESCGRAADFYSARKWREIRQARWRWRRVHTL